MLRFEQEAWNGGFLCLAGVDEAGRGPLAGPVVAAALIFERRFLEREATASLLGLTDSKKLSSARREFFCALLMSCPHVRFGIAEASVEEIDALNILRATHLAMARAIAQLVPPPDLVLVDGLPVRGLPVAHRAIVKGDGQSLSIAGASVLAKVTRDNIMKQLAVQFPEYGFERHKGYGTAKHMAALQRFGPCAAHRKSFAPVSQRLLEF